MRRKPPPTAAKPGRIVNGGAAKQTNSPKAIDRTPRTSLTRFPPQENGVKSSEYRHVSLQVRVRVPQDTSQVQSCDLGDVGLWPVSHNTRSMTRDIRPELTEFGLRLRELRGRRDLTQEQLAHLAGVDRAWISSAETGRRNATLTTLYRLAEALSVDPGELLIGTSSTPKNR